MINTKSFSRIAALLLAAVMMLSLFAACKKDEPAPADPTAAPAEQTAEPASEATEEPTEAPTEEPTPEPAISGDASALVGRWECSYNIAETMNAVFAEDDTGMYSDLHLSDAYMKLYATFNADGTYLMEVDEESQRAAMEQLVDELVPYMKELIIGLYTAFAEPGQELTEEEILEAMEIESWDQLGEQMLSEMDDGEGDLNDEGTYEYADGKLTFNANDGASEVLLVTVNGGEFSIDSVENGTDFSDEMLPMVFHKVG